MLNRNIGCIEINFRFHNFGLYETLNRNIGCIEIALNINIYFPCFEVEP